MLERIRRMIEEFELVIKLTNTCITDKEIKKQTEKLKLCVLLLQVVENQLEEYGDFIEAELNKLD